MAAAYLWFNAAMYLGLALWCTVRADAAAKALGYEQLSADGRTEFLTIYGGLEFALAAVFGCLAYNHLAWPLGMLFSAILYGSLVAWRLYGFWRHRPRSPMIRRLAVGELVLLLIPLAMIPTLRGS